MPLIVISGIPCCGKSKRAQEVASYFQERKKKDVIIVSENVHSSQSRNDLYCNSHSEKITRGILKAEVLRNISTEKLVILDGLNYIKGFRYELYCIAKQHKTPHCVLQCIIDNDQAWQWNQQKDPSQQYSKEIFDGLIYRYEAPDSRNRWDSPMFSILLDNEPPYEAMFDALYLRKPPPPNQSTQIQPLSSNNFIFELDKATQEVVSAIMSVQKTSTEGLIKIEGASESIMLNRKITLGELTRHRRQFISYTKISPIEDTTKIKNLFTQYLSTAFDS